MTTAPLDTSRHGENMNLDERVRMIIGDLMIANAMLTVQVEELKKKIEALKPKETESPEP